MNNKQIHVRFHPVNRQIPIYVSRESTTPPFPRPTEEERNRALQEHEEFLRSQEDLFTSLNLNLHQHQSHFLDIISGVFHTT